MAKKPSACIQLPKGLSTVSADNCSVENEYVLVTDATKPAKLILKDDAGEYVVSWFVNFGWAWGE